MTVVGVGSEIVECHRIGQMIERHGESFLRRVFTSAEIRYCSARALATQQYAAQWAAKNAVRKALGLQFGTNANWRDIEIQTHHDGRAKVRLGGSARDSSVSQGIMVIHVTLSTSRTMAIAFAVLEKEETVSEW